MENIRKETTEYPPEVQQTELPPVQQELPGIPQTAPQAAEKNSCLRRKKNAMRRFREGKFFRMIYDGGMLYFVLSFAISAIIMAVAMGQAGIRPFSGNNQMLVVDLWHQYYPFFRVEREKLLTGGSFFYSWQNGLGSNWLSLISYYAMSPLNWLSVFWNENHVREALTVILVMKIGFCGAFFQRFLRYTYKRNDFSTCVFSVMYALSSFTLGYYWNVMWFDTVALFPLVMLGIVKICREGKWKTYTFALALSMISNYYIGYFTCIFSIFMFAAAGIIEFRSVRDWLYKLWLMLRSSILGLGISAFMLIPAYLGLETTYSADDRSIWRKIKDIFAEDTQYYESWEKLLANTISYNSPTKVEGLPNFACGMLAIALFGVFLISMNVKIREKISSLAMLFIVVISCNMRQLNYIWHGFHFTNQIPYRFAFIFSFVLAASAYRAYDVILRGRIKLSYLAAMLVCPAFVFWLNYKVKKDDTTADIFDLKKAAIIAGIIAGALLILTAAAGFVYISILKKRGQRVPAAKNQRLFLAGITAAAVSAVLIIPFILLLWKEKQFSSFEAFKDSVIITGAFWFIFLAAKVFPFRQREVRNALMSLALAAAVLTEFYSNACKGVDTVGHSGYREYPSHNDEVISLLNEAEKSDDDLFYRTEMTETYTLNDSALYGYYGVSQFSSAANVEVTRLCKRLGLYASEAGNRFYYNTNTPVTSALFGLKYIIKRGGQLHTESYALELVGQAGSSTIYKNRYSLPIGFMVNSDVLGMTNKEAVNPFEYQNEIMHRATGSEKNCFNAQPVALAEYHNMEVSKSGYGNYTYRIPEEAKSASTVYTFDHHNGQHLYGYGSTTGKAITNVSVRCGADTVETGDLISKYPLLFTMGNGAEGDKSTVELTASGEKQSGNYKLMIYALDEAAFREQYEALADEPLILTSFSDTKLKGKVNALSDGVLYLSVPYEKGWTAYVDGKKADTFRVFGAMTGIKVSAGEHTVRLEYIPDGFIPGLLISGGSALVTGALIWFEIRRKRRKSKKSGASPEPEEKIVPAEPDNEKSIAAGEVYDQTAEEIKPEETPAAEEENEKPESNDSVQGD